MKSQKLSYLMLLTIIFSVAIPTLTLATSVDEINSKEAQVQKETDVLSTELNSVMDSINNKYQELAKLDEEILVSQKEIEQAELDIVATQDSIEKRTELVANRMKSAQIRGVSQNSLQALLDSESIGDFVNRAYAVTVIQNAEKSKIDSLYNDKAKLAALETQLVKTQAGLQTKQAEAKAEQATLDVEVAGLQEKIAANRSVMQELTSQRIAQENIIREAAAAKAAEEALKASQQNKISANNTNSNTNSNVSADTTTDVEDQNTTNVPPVTPNPAPQPTPPSANGISGEATAYVATGNNTATGSVPTPGRTIAVDPNLIPLGSVVKIDVPSLPGYSKVYIAEDTGGAVRGPIVDIFVSSLPEARQFGRRGIIITVL